MKKFKMLMLLLSLLPLPLIANWHCQNRKYCVAFTPEDGVMDLVIKEIKAAKTSLHLAVYNFKHPVLLKLINQKIEEGLKVEILLDYQSSFKHPTYNEIDLSKSNVKAYRLPVLRGGNPQMHNKLMVIDNKTVLTGSANFSSYGLLANFENVMKIEDSHLLKPIKAEIRELKALAKKTCQIFAQGDCDKAPQNYHPIMDHFFMKGSFKLSELQATQKGCKSLANGKGLLNRFNQLRSDRLLNCFIDPDLKTKLQELVAFYSKRETFIDGRNTIEAPQTNPLISPLPANVLFGPEDPIQLAITYHFEKALKSPLKTRIYLATNFITNKTIVDYILKFHQAGGDIQILFDQDRFTNKGFQFQIRRLATLGFFGPEQIVNEQLAKIKIENPYPPKDPRNKITLVKNSLPVKYGSLHHKFAVFVYPDEIVTLNGSANWSHSGVEKNGENLFIFSKDNLAGPFLRQFFQLKWTYRDDLFSHDEVIALSQDHPCLKKAIGLKSNCDRLEGDFKGQLIASFNPNERCPADQMSMTLMDQSIPLINDSGLKKTILGITPFPEQEESATFTLKCGANMIMKNEVKKPPFNFSSLIQNLSF